LDAAEEQRDRAEAQADYFSEMFDKVATKAKLSQAEIAAIRGQTLRPCSRPRISTPWTPSARWLRPWHRLERRLIRSGGPPFAEATRRAQQRLRAADHAHVPHYQTDPPLAKRDPQPVAAMDG
jgi:hypothetical protein